MRALGLVLLGCIAQSTIPQAAIASETDADVLRRFGIFGRLALNCGAPFSSSNPQQIYALSPGGSVTRTLRLERGDATLTLRNVRMLTSDMLRFEELGRQSVLTVTIVKIDGKFRNWDSTQADGIARIDDGRFSDSGKPTVTFNYCGS